MKALEEMVAEIRFALVMGQPAITPGIEEYDRAIHELLEGNKKPLVEFMQRGGQVPSTKVYNAYLDQHYPSNGGYAERPRFKKREELSPRGKPPAGRHNPERTVIDKDRPIRSGPVMLPVKERGASSVNRQL